MITAEYIKEHYVGIPLEGYRSFVFGLEKVTDIWFELIALGEQEWKEVGDDVRIGEFLPDFAASARHEANGNLGVFTVRSLETTELAGYFVGAVGTPLKTAGEKTFNEVGVYLRPDARVGRLFNAFLRYIENGAKHFGCTALVVSHRPEHTRIGRLYQRAGFTPLSHDYIKRLDP